jgi:hypothetical protein
MALEMGQYFAYTMTTWHEVLTYFGYKCLFFASSPPRFPGRTFTQSPRHSPRQAVLISHGYNVR